MSGALVITHPPRCKNEYRYIFKVVFKEFLGLSYTCREIPCNEIQVQLANASEEGILLWPDVFFQQKYDMRFTVSSLPKEPLPVWNVTHDLPQAKVLRPDVPIIYGKPLKNGAWFQYRGKTIRLGLDIAGSIFFMLTRYEELVLPDRDKHGRFPARASLAYRVGFLDRPIVDEYIEVLWACMKRIWPGLQRKRRSYQVCLSHDVDCPLVAVDKPWHTVLRGIAGDIAKRKDLWLAWQRFMAKCNKNPRKDPANTFEFIMHQSEKYGLRSAFYFKGGHTNEQFDDKYSLDMPWIKNLMRRIYDHGHEIGLHPSYETYRNLEALRTEFVKLLQVAEKLKILQDVWGGRQHYLRWENPTTWQIWEDVGLNYDSTLSFADHVGFRCGTCHEFPVFNLKTRKALRLRERPLVAMEGTLLNYMNLQPEEVLSRVEHLARICRYYEGNFTLLVHNSSLLQLWQRDLYSKILKSIT